MQKNEEIDEKLVKTLYYFALYMTADERTKRAVDLLLSLNESQLEILKEIAHATD